MENKKYKVEQLLGSSASFEALEKFINEKFFYCVDDYKLLDNGAISHVTKGVLQQYAWEKCRNRYRFGFRKLESEAV